MRGRMAGGFFWGFIQGAVLSGVALAGLSLMRPVEAPPRAGAGAEAPEARPADPTPTPVSEPRADPDAGTAARGPAADRLDLPVGSEFGRAGDLPPLVPGSASGSAPARSGAAPAIAAPEADAGAAPRLDAPTALPETLPDAGAPAQPAPDAGGDSPALALPEDRPAVAAPAAAPALPALQQGSAPDDGPRLPAPDLAPDAAPAVPAAAPGDDLPEAPAPEQGGQVQRTPAQTSPAQTSPAPTSPPLPSPALDLSLPPDLSDLRRLERN